MSWKPRQRSEISLSLASVLVISVKVRRFFLKVAASASEALRRTSPSASCSRLSAGSERQLLAVDVEAQLGHRLVEQAVPGAAPGDRFFVEELLDAVLELVGLVLPEIEHPGPVVAERRIGVERLRRSARRRPGSVPARRTADARWRRSSSPGCRRRAWRAAGRTCRRHRPGRHRRRCGRSAPPAPRIRAAPRRAGRPRPSRLRPRACPSSGSRTRPRRAPACSRSRLQLRRVHAGIEVGEVPFRQVAERRRALPGRRRCRLCRSENIRIIVAFRLPKSRSRCKV